MSSVNRMLNMPLSYSWKEKVTHIHVQHLSLSLSFLCVYCVCMNEHRETPALEHEKLNCGTHLFAQKFQQGEIIIVINSIYL